MNIKGILDEIKGETYITCIPLEEFGDIKELERFIKECRANDISTSIEYETSNFHCGVLVKAYDKKTCTVKNEILK